MARTSETAQNRATPTFDYQPGWGVGRASRVDDKYQVLAGVCFGDIADFQGVEFLPVSLEDPVRGLQGLPIFEPIETRLRVPCEEQLQTQRTKFIGSADLGASPNCQILCCFKGLTGLLFQGFNQLGMLEKALNSIYLLKFFAVSSVSGTPHIVCMCKCLGGWNNT